MIYFICILVNLNPGTAVVGFLTANLPHQSAPSILLVYQLFKTS